MKKRYTLYIFLVCVLIGGSIKAYKIYDKFYYQPELTVIGFVEMWDGIGRQSAEIIEALANDCSIRFWETRKGSSKDLPKAVAKIVKRKKARLGKVAIYEDIFYPSSSEYFSRKFNDSCKDSIKIAYTMFESTVIPDDWVENLNTYFDMAIVPDPFYVKVYQDSGVKIPIFVLPLGLNLQDFLERPLKQKKSDAPLTFGYFSTCYLRKNHVDLVKAFHKAFQNSDQVRLVINCKQSTPEALADLKKTIKDLGCTNIQLTTHCLDRAEYLQLFESIDCYVSLSKSEGFSKQPREAMALGLPVIVSNNTAQKTICDSQLVTPVSCPTEEPAYYEHFRNVYGVRFNIDIEEAANTFKDVYENYDKKLINADKRRDWAKQYDFENLKKYYKTIVKPKKLSLGDENLILENELITNSKELYEKYVRLGS